MMKLTYNRKIVATILYSSVLLYASSSQAANNNGPNQLGGINLELSVEIVAFTCGISIDQNNKVIELGTWSNQHFRKKGDKTTETMIRYNVSDCPTISEISFSFSGPKDRLEPELLAINPGALSAQNIAIELLDSEKKHLALNTASPKIQLDKNGNGQATFYARYVATTASPSVGKANATATFNITYD